MSQSLLEVVVLSAADARAAAAGGADRVELVADMAADGLTPDAGVFAEVREAVEIPVRVMVRRAAGFARGVPLARLCADAEALWRAGAREFVGGWLGEDGRVDVEACEEVLGVLPDTHWTFHRAFDHTRDRAEAWETVGALTGVDTVLTSGAADGVAAGAAVLAADAAAACGPRILVGGGLRAEHVGQLRAAGLDAFHIGTPARPRGWASPVDAEQVAVWRELVG
ncbi:copper homeostasis protein CutC [Yinghuangia soli]|uniref:Copper homeostasis protein cutC homolog n=1 Tax=Yinghuangia soli TaxID=2908204 RepID=A0AA41PXA7_9ACTN|nr:copper homeostasis protein CutC [Yinghuangia soli]MCF2527590.1 copper homeostasis protein CutC [Yinghuangia soli]